LREILSSLKCSLFPDLSSNRQSPLWIRAFLRDLSKRHDRDNHQ
jgi:hypothetical protein